MIPLLIFFVLILLTYLYAKWYTKQGFADTDREAIRNAKEPKYGQSVETIYEKRKKPF